jgi:serine phosphatase RsbU (regulator of sigma subunit)
VTLVAKNWSQASFTSEFGHELEAERQAWLRRRFIWYVGVGLTIGFFSVLWMLNQPSRFGWLVWTVQIGVSVLTLAAQGAALLYVWRNRNPKIPILTIVYWLILSGGLLVLVPVPLISGGIAGAMNAKADQTERVGVPGGLESDRPSNQRSQEPAESPSGDGEAASHAPIEPEPTGRRGINSESMGTVAQGVAGVGTIFLSHFFACVFLPWTARESLRPIVPLLAVNAILTGGLAGVAALSGNWSWGIAWAGISLVVLSLLMPLPGIAVCLWRDSRFRQRFTFDTLRGRYSELKAELFNARQIHESLFPRPLNTGPVRFGYVYEPMRQIGGDYLHSFISRPTLMNDGSRASPGDSYNFVLVDVTGHGIPAALTVNRLHGELARIFAENPETTPGEVLRLLNSYVHLTLATHSVYVTAICIRIRPTTDLLQYASGGHPPAFLKAVDGTVEQLDSTAFVLGACAGADFRSDQKEMRFGPGDTLIAYTDGATEARDLHGRYFGIAGLQRIIATSHPESEGGWPATILKGVEGHRYGPTADDILLIEVRRPVNMESGAKTRVATAVTVGNARR